MTESLEQNKPIPLGEKLRAYFGNQTQYLVRYFDPTFQSEYPYLGKDLRISNLETGDWHSVTIHPDDVAEAISRLEVVLGKPDTSHQGAVDVEPANLPDWMKE